MLQRWGVLRGERRHVPLEDARDERGHVVAVEGALARAQLKEEAAERPHVGLVPVLLASVELRAHVEGRAHTRGRQALVHHLGDAKVAELEESRRGDEDVLRLEVAVQDAALVHVVQRERQLHQPLQDLLLRERLACHRDPPRQVGTRTVPVMRGHTLPGEHAALCRWHVQHAGGRCA